MARPCSTGRWPAGHEVRALTRRPQPPRRGVDWIAGDLADAGALAALVEGAEALIHVAGAKTSRDPAVLQAGNVAGTLAVIEAARRAGTPRLLCVSSLAAREPGLSEYGGSKARAEKLVAASGIDWTIIRPPAIYGPRDKDMLDLFRAARWGVVPMPREGAASLIHVDDLAALLLALLPGGEAVTGKVFEPDDGKRGGWRHRELARAIGWAVGRRPLVWGLSSAALHRAARFDTAIRRSRAKMTADRAGYFAHPDWVVSLGRRVPGDLWTPQVPTREGLKATAQWYREQGWM